MLGLRERMTLGIKNRKDMECRRLDVPSLLYCHGMENYTDVCCSRIINEAESDDLETQGIEMGVDLDSNRSTIQLTSKGVLKCKEILLGYLPEEVVVNVFEIICREEEVTKYINSAAGALRNMKTTYLMKELFKMIILRKEEGIEGIQDYYCLELFCRSHFWKAIKGIREMKDTVYKKVKCRRMVTEITKQAKTVADEQYSDL